MSLFFRRVIHFARRTMPPPDRWEAYSPMGSVIPGTKFLAFKVPLKNELLQKMEEKDKFSPEILMKLVGDKGLKLGGVIDLTFTFKYYNRHEFVKNSIEHTKIFTPGHVVPDDSVFQQFAHAVKKFDGTDNDQIIGVHCTHGVNRTGYLICRYMIEEMSFEPDVAISLFGEARGHELERENYLQDLKTRKCGQSTYDPNFKVQDEDIKTGGNRGHTKEKPRWRDHRDDHPYWRRKYHHQAEERGMRYVPGSYTSPLDDQYVPRSYTSPLDDQRLPYPGNLGLIYPISGSAYGGPYNSYSQDTNYSGVGPVCAMPRQYFEDARFSGSRSIPEHFIPSGSDNSYPVDRPIHENPYRLRSNSRNQSHRFNPIDSYRAPGANRGRRDEHRSDRKNDVANSELTETQS